MLYIYKVHLLHFIWDNIRKLGKFLAGIGRKKDLENIVLYYPPFESIDDVSNHLNRLSWYLPKRDNIIINVLVTSKSLLNACQEGLSRQLMRPECQDTEYSFRAERIEFVVEKYKWRLLMRSKLVLWWKKQGVGLFERIILSIISHTVDALSPPPTHAGQNLSRISNYLISKNNRNSCVKQNHKKLIELKDSLKEFHTSYIFGSGPSLREAFEYDFSDGVRIICNSLVKYDKLLDHLQPQIVVAADDTFHFSCARYAGEFLRDCLKVIRKYNAKFIVPTHVSFFLLDHYPELISSLISIPIAAHSLPKLNFDLIKRFYIDHNDTSVLGILLIPLGCTLTDRVCLLGFDGKGPKDTRWWNYDKDAQYSDEIYNSLISCFPAFFEYTNYDKRDRIHLSCISSILKAARRKGFEFVSLVPSFVPAINELYKPREIL